MAERTEESHEAGHGRILERCDYLVDVHLWPLKGVLDPARWLKNFKPDERDHAEHLLKVFLYFSEPMVNALLLGAFQNLSRLVRESQPNLSYVHARWQSFFRYAADYLCHRREPKRYRQWTHIREEGSTATRNPGRANCRSKDSA
jgi:hypothetical protein